MELMELTALVDQYDAARDQRLAADKEAAFLKREENELADRLITEMYSNETFYCAGHTKRVKMTPVQKPKVTDWPALHEYMVKNDAMDLMQKRLHEGALADRLEDGEKIPGFEYVQVNKLSIGKI